jgi:DNA polymerase-1
VLFSDPPVIPAVESFTSDAAGTHGWHGVRCLAGGLAVAAARSQWAERPLAVDIESFGLGRHSARLKCVGFSSGDAAVVLDPRDRQQYEAARFLITTSPKLIFHNSAFDVPNLSRNGLITLDDVRKIEDTLIHARMAEPDERTRKTLANTGNRYLGTPTEDHLLAAFKIVGLTKEQGYYQFDIDRFVYLMGAASDAIMTARVLEHVRRAAYERLTSGHPFTENGVTGDEAWALVEREQRLNRILLRRAVKGLRADLEFLDRYREMNEVELREAEAELEAAGIRPGNAGDLIKVLDTADAIPADYPRTAKTKKPSTVADHLERLTHPIAATFVKAKQITKIDKDYLTKVVEQSGEDDRIYPAANILAAITGRMSYSGVPVHQFPEGARGIVLADEGDALTSMDWAQIEPVIIANVAGDWDMVLDYEAGTVDFYQGIATATGKPRPVAKVVLLAQLYGEGLAKLAGDLGITLDAAEELRTLIFDTLPRTADLVRPASAGKEGKLRNIARHYRVVFTLSGRILPIPMGRGWEQDDGTIGPPSPAVHKGVNFFVQGSAYDVLADTIIRVDDAGLSDAIYLLMHDEIVASTDAAHDIEKIMQTPPERLCRLAKRVPILRTDRADMGERWAKV